MEFTERLQKFDGPMWAFHIPVPPEVSDYFVVQEKTRRVRCILNGSIEIQIALMPDGNGGHFLNINKEVRSKLGLVHTQEVHVKLEKDESKYGFPLPAEMEELLNQDEQGNRIFHQLTPGKQRSLLHLVGKTKNPEIRLRKAIVIMDYLKTTGGEIDYKSLNAALKNKNRYS